MFVTAVVLNCLLIFSSDTAQFALGRGAGSIYEWLRGHLMSFQILSSVKSAWKYFLTVSSLWQCHGHLRNPSGAKKDKMLMKALWKTCQKQNIRYQNTAEIHEVGRKSFLLESFGSTAGCENACDLRIPHKYLNAVAAWSLWGEFSLTTTPNRPFQSHRANQHAATLWSLIGSCCHGNKNFNAILFFRCSYPFARLSSSSSGRLFPRRSLSLR